MPNIFIYATYVLFVNGEYKGDWLGFMAYQPLLVILDQILFYIYIKSMIL